MPRKGSAAQAAAPLVYDAGALVAADRGERQMWAQFAAAVAERRPIIVPSPVLAQVWRATDAEDISRLVDSATSEFEVAVLRPS